MTRRPSCLLLGALLLASCRAPASSPSGGERQGAAAEPQLALVRPPQPRCLARGAPDQLLVSRATLELEHGEPARALACAEEALAASPRLAAAQHARAEALAQLGRAEEARLAYAHALAIDPDRPETLLGAAELYASRASGGRADLSLSREYALRGVGSALRARHRNKDLAARLLLAAAMVENDLGESGEALEHAEHALELGGAVSDAEYERGIALYELCRFPEARSALERVLAIEPDDAWTLHYLGLIAEATGNQAQADELESRAHQLAPGEFPSPVTVTRDAFQSEVQKAVAALPEVERRALAHVPVEIADLPALDDLVAVDPPLSPSILGLFRGPSEDESCLPEEGPTCRSIVFYRRNLARFARDHRELREQVRLTLLHELGHYHGESEEDLRARGLE